MPEDFGRLLDGPLGQVVERLAHRLREVEPLHEARRLEAHSVAVEEEARVVRPLDAVHHRAEKERHDRDGTPKAREHIDQPQEALIAPRSPPRRG